jgi:hypothetical protein
MLARPHNLIRCLLPLCKYTLCSLTPFAEVPSAHSDLTVHSFLARRDPSVVMSDEYTSNAILSTSWHAINGYSNVHYLTSPDLPTAAAVSVPRPRYLPEYQRGSQAHHKDRGRQSQEKSLSLPTGLIAGHKPDHSEAQA